MQGNQTFPLSGETYFHVIVSKSNTYQVMLPCKVYRLLPPRKTRVVLTYREKTWDIICNIDNQAIKRWFSTGWKKFIDDNNIKIGDGCLFELMECSKEVSYFRVQVLRGDIPPQLLETVSGGSEDSPITIE